MKQSVLIISGWAHGLNAIQPLGDALADRFDVQLRTGAEVLRDRCIPETDYIVTGSMSGLLAMELLPEHCRKLVLISSTAKFCAGEGYACGTPEKVLRRMIVQLKRKPEAVLEEFFRNVHFPHRQNRQGIALKHENTGELLDGLEYLLAADVRDKVPALEIPVLLLHGAQDRIIPPSASEWLHAHLPDSRLRIFDQHGHALPAHCFTPVMSELQAFLEQ
ncbi:MAG: hypothetical protein HKP10_08815 [Kiritimatiellales bacterium]|nr:hypothetical protein [Kiritimatiellales bacterium]